MISCLIGLRAHIGSFNRLTWRESDALLHQTAVNKYVIGMELTWDHNNILSIVYKKYIKTFNYPYIEINPEKRISKLKCPTINNGIWRPNGNEFPLCTEKVRPVKGRHFTIGLRF